MGYLYTGIAILIAAVIIPSLRKRQLLFIWVVSAGKGIKGIYSSLRENMVVSSEYNKYVSAAGKITTVIDIINEELLNPDKRAVARDVLEGILGKVTDPDTKRLTTLYILYTNRSTISHNFRLLASDNHNRADVKVVTLVFVDLLGEIFDLQDQLDADYYEHIIFVINRVLLSVRDNGFNKKIVKNNGRMLFRMYKLTKAFMSLKASKNLTQEQFYEKIINIVGMFNK